MDKQEYVMGVRGMIRLYEVILENRCSGLGLSLLELNILNFLFYNLEKNTASDIVEYRMLPKANVSKGIDSLVRKSYVRREEDASDRRRTNLYLLPAAEPITQAIDAAQASDVVKSKRKGLDEMVEQGGLNFSGGQRQRLTIARALVKRPEILILDDSASALDYATDAALRRSIKNLDYKPTVFIVSQRTSSIRNADKIIVLEHGEVAGIGTHEELLKNCELYREIHYSQYEKKEEA